MQIRPERPGDGRAIFEVEKAAFGRVAEAELVDRLRDLGELALSLVAVAEGEVLGHVAFSPVTISNNPEGLHALGLGPLAVLPGYRRGGVGARLIEAGLAAAAKAGWDPVFVLGDPAYYRHFGFETAADHGLRWEGEAPPEAFMACSLSPGVLAHVGGVVRYHFAFGAV